jgi:hypothetical protein
MSFTLRRCRLGTAATGDRPESIATFAVLPGSGPLYLPSGGTFHEGLIYYSCLGGNITAGQEFRPGIYTLNATSGKSQSLLNNYFGYYFNGCDDIVVDSRGDVWFTDNCKPFQIPATTGG